MLLPFVAVGMPLMYNVVDVITTFNLFLADVLCQRWLMELPQVCHVADGITTWQMLWPRVEWLADVIYILKKLYTSGSTIHP